MFNRLSSLLATTALVFTAAPMVQAQTLAEAVVAASGGATAGVFDDDRNDYDILLNAINAADPAVLQTLSDPNQTLTAFIPNDAAFIKLARDFGYVGDDESDAWDALVDALTTLGNGNPGPVVTDVLLYHVAGQEISAFGFILRSFFRRDIETLLSGATIRPFFLFLIDNDPDLRNPRLMNPINLRASNGIAHGINRVLVPLDV